MNFPAFDQARILICGDIMLDRYWHGQSTRLSPEAPVPVVHYTEQTDRLGGAANVAHNIRRLGGQATLQGIIGQDAPANSLRHLLTQADIAHHLIPHPTASTHTKLRIVDQQQLLRVDFADPLTDPDAQAQLQQAYTAALPHHQVVVLSDYAKGTLDDPQPYIQASRAAQIPILIDPKGTDYQRYQGATLLTPNLAEYTAVVGDCSNLTTLADKGQQLIQDCQLQALLITQGEQGMTLLQAGQAPYHLPTQAQEVYDVTGAGDTVIATLASALGVGSNLRHAVRLANLAAGLVVAKRGTAYVSAPELHSAYHTSQTPSTTAPCNYRPGICNATELAAQIRAARQRGEHIVFTNGCFDILHAGHTACLAQAAALGDRLIVATNSDTSIRALKGPTRPINSQQHRLAVLAALQSVDWVIMYEDLTPENLIQQIQPDVLVKGTEYRNDTIPGAEATRAAGGKVVFIETANSALSTSQIIASIQARQNT